MVTGSFGQVGTELLESLVQIHGHSEVLATDIRIPDGDYEFETEVLDVTDQERIRYLMKKHSVTSIFHLAAILSALGERMPDRAFDVNLTGTFNILKAARDLGVEKVIIPSTIGVFGSETPRENVPAVTVERPETMYGITKVAAELLSSYFRRSFSLDVRGVRYPGLISYKTLPSAGTTDYAVDMIRYAVAGKDYVCYLKPDTVLPMMYMPDAIKALLNVWLADGEKLRYALEYNIQAFSFSPAMLEKELRAHFPDFRVDYRPDYRQGIADSWPSSLDVTDAVRDWGFSCDYDFKTMVSDMIEHLEGKQTHGEK